MFGQPDFFVSQMPAPSWKPASMAFDYTTVPDPDVQKMWDPMTVIKTQINLFFHLFFRTFAALLRKRNIMLYF